MTKEEMLDIEVDSDGDIMTIREYFCALLTTLWQEGEGFSGKRPLGYSGWEHDLYHALAGAGVIEGASIEDGQIEGWTREANKAADELIESLIVTMCKGNVS